MAQVSIKMYMYNEPPESDHQAQAGCIHVR